MEDALVLEIASGIFSSVEEVLILVLMEDALVLDSERIMYIYVL